MSNTTPTWQNTTLNDYLYKDGNIPAGWEAFFNNAKTKSAIAEISKGLTEALSQTATLDPPLHKVFKAFELSLLDKTKAIIVGQDPAPELGLAQGISFSIPT